MKDNYLSIGEMARINHTTVPLSDYMILWGF